MKDETRKLLDKASRAVGVAVTLLEDGNADFAAGRMVTDVANGEITAARED